MLIAGERRLMARFGHGVPLHFGLALLWPNLAIRRRSPAINISANHYSDWRAVLGSTPAARTAGTQLAAIATATSTTVTITNTAGSRGD